MTKRKNGRPHRRAVGVVRISKNRDDETSTTTQEERIAAYCAAHDLDLVEVVVDAGRSAYKEDRASRPGLRRARQLIKTGAADVMVSWKVDRVARNTRDLLNLIHDLENDGGAFASVTEQFDTATPIGQVVMTMVAALAQLESAQKSDRTAAWNDYRRTTGAVPAGPRPFGYQRTEKNVLVVDKAEAAQIRKAAAAVLAGESLRSITARLNEAGFRHAKDGPPMSRVGLKRILISPTTAALREVDGAFVPSDAWKPILDRTTWNEVRAVLTHDGRRTNHANANSRRWVLAGLLKCGMPDCGLAMNKKGHNNGPRYACPTHHLSIPAEPTDEMVAGTVLGSLDLRAWRRLQARGRRHVDTTEIEDRLADLARRVADHELTEAEWEIRRAGLLRDLEDAAAEPVALPDVDDPRKAWPDLDVDAKRLILTALLPGPVTILPATPGLARFDDTRIEVPPVP
jgi:DNA invertase Pin-like site-specific DNA recombinase